MNCYCGGVNKFVCIVYKWIVCCLISNCYELWNLRWVSKDKRYVYIVK